MSKEHFAIGSVVYHVVDGCKGIVTGIVYRSDCVRYLVTFGHGNENEYFPIELTTQKQYKTEE